MSRTIDTDFGLVQVGWDGRPLAEPLVALDAETERIQSPARIPGLVMLAASDGDRHVIVHPDDTARFLAAHAHTYWAGHNMAGFDFAVLVEHLRRRGESDDLLWQQAARGRLRDSLLLAQLANLAVHGDPRAKETWPDLTLETLARDLCGLVIDKEADSGYRLNYADIAGLPFEAIKDDGWFIYAARDAQASFHVYSALAERAVEIAHHHGVERGVFAAHGPLSESVQVQGAIALDALERHGLATDEAQRNAIQQELNVQVEQLRGRIDEIIHADAALACIGSPFTIGSDGGLKGSHKALEQLLEKVAAHIQETALPDWVPPRSSRSISRRAEDWAPLAGHHPLLAAWMELEQTRKLRSCLPPGDVHEVHPRYTVLVRTGRTACSRPNIQQVPKGGRLRTVYAARPGHVLIGADYSAIELRTLAQVCLARYGRSTLADVFHRGDDPHVITAASIRGMSPQQFQQLPEDEWKTWRQRAKAANFGFPAGLGPATFVAYARSYGIELDEAEALKLKEAFLRAYPELDQYLNERIAMTTLADNLQCDPRWLWPEGYGEERPKWMPAHLLRVLRGESHNSRGQPYPSEYIHGIMSMVRGANRNPRLETLLKRGPCADLARELQQQPVVTLTGRVRARCSFTMTRNTPFQGLAADGAKLALFDLLRTGYRIVAFVHDEILVEVPEDGDVATAGEDLCRIMIEQMRRVVPDVPIEVGDPTVMRRWSEPVAQEDPPAMEVAQ